MICPTAQDGYFIVSFYQSQALAGQQPLDGVEIAGGG